MAGTIPAGTDFANLKYAAGENEARPQLDFRDFFVHFATVFGDLVSCIGELQAGKHNPPAISGNGAVTVTTSGTTLSFAAASNMSNIWSGATVYISSLGSTRTVVGRDSTNANVTMGSALSAVASSAYTYTNPDIVFQKVSLGTDISTDFGSNLTSAVSAINSLATELNALKGAMSTWGIITR